MKKTIAMVLVIVGIFCFAPQTQAFSFLGYDPQASALYSTARAAARMEEYDAAFLSFRDLLENYPESRYASRSLFAVGEYYFLNGNYREAAPIFLELVNDDPEAKNAVFCLAYLLKIAQNNEDQELIAKLEHAIVTFHQLSLVFRESKQFSYRSSLSRRHKVIYYIDKVEFYVNGELFAQISY